eukprot:6944038-Pyramimonas_sp.AAC.1
MLERETHLSRVGGEDVGEGDGGVGHHVVHVRVTAHLPGPGVGAVRQLLADVQPCARTTTLQSEALP